MTDYIIPMKPVACAHCGERIWVPDNDAGPVFCHESCQDLHDTPLKNQASEREPNGEAIKQPRGEKEECQALSISVPSLSSPSSSSSATELGAGGETSSSASSSSPSSTGPI